jgi:hypothetical protein
MTSTRKSQIAMILDELENPTFKVIDYSDRYTEFRFSVVETPRLLMSPSDDNGNVTTLSTFFRTEFRDKSTAVFCANMKRAEAILAAIEAIK